MASFALATFALATFALATFALAAVCGHRCCFLGHETLELALP